MFTAGILSGLGIIVILLQFDFKKVLGYSLMVDIGSTVGLSALFLGTYSGMMTGIVGGLTVTVVLAVSKMLFGYKKMTLHGWETYS